MKKLLYLLATCSLCSLAWYTPAQEDLGFVIVINAANSTVEADRDRVRKFFLKRLKRWDDDVPVAPVDLLPDSEVRDAFTREVFGKKVSTIKSYWQRMIFSGKAVPPPELTSDAEVLGFVRGDPGGIGYVSSGAELGEGVKELKLVE